VSAPLNWIPEEQNTPWALDRVAAKTALYDRARTLATLQVVLAVVVPVAAAVLAVPFPELMPWGALYGIAMVLLEPLALEARQSRHRELAAKVQEEFDCHLFQLDWREGRVGPRPRPEDVAEWANRHRSRAKARDAKVPGAKLRDWYPAVVGRLPLSRARLVCQRANGVWDSRMRARYADRIAVLLCAAAAVILVGGLATGDTLREWAVRSATLAPLIGWAIRERRTQRAAADRREDVQQRADAIWRRSLATILDDPQLTEDARELQNDIYTQRTESPAVFRWVYESSRDEDEAAMQHGAEVLVGQYELAHRPPSAGASSNSIGGVGEGPALAAEAGPPELARTVTK
jgi:hypothetical protein